MADPIRKRNDPIAELRTKAEQLVAIGDHVKNQWRASEWQRTQCLDNAPLVAKAMLALLDDLARYKAALEFYANDKNWTYQHDEVTGLSLMDKDDYGECARQALKGES